MLKGKKTKEERRPKTKTRFLLFLTKDPTPGARSCGTPEGLRHDAQLKETEPAGIWTVLSLRLHAGATGRVPVLGPQVCVRSWDRCQGSEATVHTSPQALVSMTLLQTQFCHLFTTCLYL